MKNQKSPESFIIDIADFLDDKPEVTWTLSLILPISSMKTGSHPSFVIDTADVLDDEKPDITWGLSLIFLIFSMTKRKSPELCHWNCWSARWQIRCHLSFAIDITDLYDEKLEVIDIADLLDDKTEVTRALSLILLIC